MIYSSSKFPDKVFPPKPVIERPCTSLPPTNCIVQVQTIIYGEMGSGKTATANSIAHFLINKYGRENVNVCRSRRDLGNLMKYGIKDKLVNFLICEDLTGKDISRDLIPTFFDLRHLVTEKTGRRNGLLITLLTCHRFHGIREPSLRTDCKLFIAKSLPMNPYDENVIYRFIGEKIGNELEKIEGLKDVNSKLKGISGVYYARKRYLVDFPLVKENYLSPLVVPEKKSVFDMPLVTLKTKPIVKSLHHVTGESSNIPIEEKKKPFTFPNLFMLFLKIGYWLFWLAISISLFVFVYAIVSKLIGGIL